MGECERARSLSVPPPTHPDLGLSSVLCPSVARPRVGVPGCATLQNAPGVCALAQFRASPSSTESTSPPSHSNPQGSRPSMSATTPVDLSDLDPFSPTASSASSSSRTPSPHPLGALFPPPRPSNPPSSRHPSPALHPPAQSPAPTQGVEPGADPLGGLLGHLDLDPSPSPSPSPSP